MTNQVTDTGHDTIADHVADAVETIRSRVQLMPTVGIVLGSGLGSLADDVHAVASIPYGAIPYFPQSTAPGHAGRLVLGHLNGQAVVVMAGRVHLYEGYSAQRVTFPVRVMRALGAQTLIITNAAGGVRTDLDAGALMLITDHINLTGQNPLVGENQPSLGVRFPDMTYAYDPDLQALARSVAAQHDIKLAEGVYLGLLGPSYETPAEIRMARSLGADAVGMSTVMEVIAARHAGLRVLAISCITNMAAGILPQKLDEQEVIETAAAVRDTFITLIRGLLSRLADAQSVDTEGR